MNLSLLAPLVMTLFVLLGGFAWVFPRGTAGALLTITAAAIAIVASLELEGAGLSEAYAYVAGFALAQPALVVLMTLPGRFDACAYWRPERLPTIALDVTLVVSVGAALGSLTVFALTQLHLLAGDRGTAALATVAFGSMVVFMRRTRRFRSDTTQESLTAVSL